MPVGGINNNIAYRRALSDFSRVDRQGFKHRERLATGERITSGKDGAGHLAVSEGMRAEIGGLTEGALGADRTRNSVRRPGSDDPERAVVRHGAQDAVSVGFVAHRPPRWHSNWAA